jgi:hypothetical protein
MGTLKNTFGEMCILCVVYMNIIASSTYMFLFRFVDSLDLPTKKYTQRNYSMMLVL